MKKYLPFLFFLLLLSKGGSSHLSDFETLSDSCKNTKYETSEPGTCLSLSAYRFLNALDKIDKNPYNNEFTRKVIDFFEPRVYQTINMEVPGDDFNVPVRIYYPTKKSTEVQTQIILFIHGGGFMFGSIEEYDMAVKKLARITDKIIVALDYRLAPSHPFPAGLNDSYLVLKWLSENSRKIGGLSNKIVVMGDSAGGNLATVLALKNRDEKTDYIAAQILFYPPTTFLEKEFPSRTHFLRDERRSYLLTEEFLRITKSSYLPDSIDERHPYASPLEADLNGNLPPSLIVTAKVDPLRDDGRFYAEKLRQSNQDITYVEYDGIVHGFFNFYMIFKESKQSMKLVRDFTNKILEAEE